MFNTNKYVIFHADIFSIFLKYDIYMTIFIKYLYLKFILLSDVWNLHLFQTVWVWMMIQYISQHCQTNGRLYTVMP